MDCIALTYMDSVTHLLFHMWNSWLINVWSVICSCKVHICTIYRFYIYVHICNICRFYIYLSSFGLGDGIRGAGICNGIYRQCDSFISEVRDSFMSDVWLFHDCIILRLMASNSVRDSFLCGVRGCFMYGVRDSFMSDLWLFHILIILRLMAPRSGICNGIYVIVNVMTYVWLYMSQWWYTTAIHTATYRQTLQHTATNFNTLPHTATHCSTLQHAATHCKTLQLINYPCGLHTHTPPAYTATSHNATDVFTSSAMHNTATNCTTQQHTATHCTTLQHTPPHCNLLQNTAT